MQVATPVGAIYPVVDGSKTCKVAFVSKSITLTDMLDLIENNCVTFTELYAHSSNPYKVLKDTKMNGMAVCTVVDTAGHLA